jgi:DNA-binding PadR family transcriptional regulator
MWLGKFLDLKDDLKQLSAEIKKNIMQTIKKDKLTPLEFTILETIFNNPNGLYGYDLIDALNTHFAGTWKAKSGTVYPILSKLKRDGFLDSKNVKSPIGPIKKVYTLTEAGKAIIKRKVSINFLDQVKFMENFLIELLKIYLNTIQDEEKDQKSEELFDLIDETFNNVNKALFQGQEFKKECPDCNTVISRRGSAYCSYCGSSLISGDSGEGEFEPTENLN